MGLFGITGKRGLWTALATAADTAPQLQKLDYARLEKRAAEQCGRVDAKRLELSSKIFGSA